MKKHQEPKSVKEQVKNLKDIGCIIEDEQKAAEFLDNVSYFRLIKGFGITFKEKNSNYRQGTTFNQIKGLYIFNAKLRHLIFPEIEKIEVNFRCRVANYFCCKYGVMGYKDCNNFIDKERHNKLLFEIESEIQRNKKSPFVRNFQDNYEGGELPLYAAVELFSFGTLSKFYKNMKGEDKKAIAQQYDTTYTYLESWIEHLAYVRNICAHYGRLYNCKYTKSPMLYKEYTSSGVSPLRFYATLVCFKYLLPMDEHWEKFIAQIGYLVNEYPCVDVKFLGFIDGKYWGEYLLREVPRD